MAPTPAELTVATGALRTEAGVWREQSGVLTGIAATVGGLDFSGIEAGIFQIIVVAHRELVEHVAARCTEGGVETARIADTLVLVADTYEEEERRNEHALRGLY